MFFFAATPAGALLGITGMILAWRRGETTYLPLLALIINLGWFLATTIPPATTAIPQRARTLADA